MRPPPEPSWHGSARGTYLWEGRQAAGGGVPADRAAFPLSYLVKRLDGQAGLNPAAPLLCGDPQPHPLAGGQAKPPAQGWAWLAEKELLMRELHLLTASYSLFLRPRSRGAEKALVRPHAFTRGIFSSLTSDNVRKENYFNRQSAGFS